MAIMRPVTFGELRERLELAGLREVATDFGETAGTVRRDRVGGLNA